MITEELLIKWTGFQGEYLLEFYIEFRKEYHVDIDNLFILKQNIIDFQKIYNKRKFQQKIAFFEKTFLKS